MEHYSETVVGNLIGKILKDKMGIVNISMCCSIDSSTITELFSIFNVSGDGSMSNDEFRFCYNEWIKRVSQSFTLKFKVNSVILFIILWF